MEKFCKATGIKRENIIFMFKGKEVFETYKPKSISMKVGDAIKVVINRSFWYKNYLEYFIFN